MIMQGKATKAGQLTWYSDESIKWFDADAKSTKVTRWVNIIY